MSSKIQPLKGMKDTLPHEQKLHSFIIDVAKKLSNLYGYEEIAVPLLEYVKIYDRTLGVSSDVVSKEMYDFMDKGERHVALRPEFTAGVMRMIISNNLAIGKPVKFFSHGPVFRYDRPQAGRQRQFQQLNFEHVGVKGPYADAEIIDFAFKLLEQCNIFDGITLEINSLGSKDCRDKYSSSLASYYRKYVKDLSNDSKTRLEQNPLRILDSKDPMDKKISLDAPKIDSSYDKESSEYFDKLKKFLDLLGVPYAVNKTLVRGLDYYSHTIFEFVSQDGGSQSTVLAGGRYDELSQMLGGGENPAIGFAAGIERMIALTNHTPKKSRSVVIIPIEESNEQAAARLASIVRAANIVTQVDISGKIPRRLQRANEDNAKFVIFIGDEESKSDKFKLKDLDKHEEKILSLMDIMKIIKSELQ